MMLLNVVLILPMQNFPAADYRYLGQYLYHYNYLLKTVPMNPTAITIKAPKKSLLQQTKHQLTF
jgi:hypothetical protein